MTNETHKHLEKIGKPKDYRCFWCDKTLDELEKMSPEIETGNLSGVALIITYGFNHPFCRFCYVHFKKKGLF